MSLFPSVFHLNWFSVTLFWSHGEGVGPRGWPPPTPNGQAVTIQIDAEDGMGKNYPIREMVEHAYGRHEVRGLSPDPAI